MTLGNWICTRCGYHQEVHLSATILKCSKCNEKYTLVKTIKPHVIHPVSITKSSDGKLNVVRPIIIAISDENPKDVREYFEILNTFYKEPKTDYIS